MEQANKEDIILLKHLIQKTHTIIVGAGSGLSTSAGYMYGGEPYHQNFFDFEEKYGIEDMYSGSFYNFSTLEEKWAFMSRMIYLNRYTAPSKQVYNDLFKLLKAKDYFIVTTNVDHCFQRAGFDKKRLFYTQGDYGLFQCSKPCTQETWDNEEVIKKMKNEQKNMRIPSDLVPKCPHCGRPMIPNLRCDDKFVEDEGWHKASERYNEFLNKTESESVLYLELGVGLNTPGIIKIPFWRRTFANPNAFFVTINYGEPLVADEIKDRSLCINDDIGNVITQLL